MLSVNPFAVAGASLPAGFLPGFLLVMAVAVVAGTLFDIVHKGSARYFFDNMTNSRDKGRELGGGELVSIAVQTAVVDVLASGEFCNHKRRVAHLLGMYGFVLYVVATASWCSAIRPAPRRRRRSGRMLWWLGALMVCVGGYWFWFFIRVDVAAEGHSPFRVMQADLFVLSLLASVTLGVDLGLRRAAAVGRALLALHHRDHGALRRRAVVEVRAHVLQAGRGLREEGIQGQWHGRESADADP